MPFLMRRRSITAYGAPLEATEVTLPDPKGREVVVRVRHCGVCHSDLHLREGRFDLGGGRHLDVSSGRALPFTLGHEIEGEVVAIGPDATDAPPIGSRRVIYPWIGCGQCDACAAGDEHVCAKPRQMGIQVDGGFADHAVVPDPRYLLDASGIPPALAGTYMCSGLTAYSALKRLGSLAERGPVLIVGLGGVGMMALAFAKAMLPLAPLVADVSESKRALALEMGAAAAFDPTDAGARKTLLKSLGGVHGAIDFAGAETSLDFAQGALKKGGKVVVVGLFGGEFRMPIPFFPMRVIAIEGSYVGPLADAEAALTDLAGGRVVGRVVLTP